jgi:hypothetical protein
LDNTLASQRKEKPGFHTVVTCTPGVNLSKHAKDALKTLETVFAGEIVPQVLERAFEVSAMAGSRGGSRGGIRGGILHNDQQGNAQVIIVRFSTQLHPGVHTSRPMSRPNDQEAHRLPNLSGPEGSGVLTPSARHSIPQSPEAPPTSATESNAANTSGRQVQSAANASPQSDEYWGPEDLSITDFEHEMCRMIEVRNIRTFHTPRPQRHQNTGSSQRLTTRESVGTVAVVAPSSPSSSHGLTESQAHLVPANPSAHEHLTPPNTPTRERLATVPAISQEPLATVPPVSQERSVPAAISRSTHTLTAFAPPPPYISPTRHSQSSQAFLSQSSRSTTLSPRSPTVHVTNNLFLSPLPTGNDSRQTLPEALVDALTELNALPVAYSEISRCLCCEPGYQSGGWQSVLQDCGIPDAHIALLIDLMRSALEHVH